jgi:hypothetical protein
MISEFVLNFAMRLEQFDICGAIVLGAHLYGRHNFVRFFRKPHHWFSVLLFEVSHASQ